MMLLHVNIKCLSKFRSNNSRKKKTKRVILQGLTQKLNLYLLAENVSSQNLLFTQENTSYNAPWIEKSACHKDSTVVAKTLIT